MNVLGQEKCVGSSALALAAVTMSLKLLISKEQPQVQHAGAEGATV